MILSIAAIQPCFSSGSSEKNTTADGTVISARGALGRLETAPSGPLFTGDGGKNIRLAVIAPQVQGETPAYLPIYIQGLLNNNFSKYSAINLIDRQNLDRIISEQKIAASGNYSDNDFVRIGNLTNAQYFLFGIIQKLSGDTYSLQLSITDSSTGVRRANFMKNGSLSQLEGSGTLINEATADMLSQLGIQLTETGKQTLLAGNTSVVKAEAGLARGITAQAGGSEVEALFNFTQAITFDPSKIETLSRLNTLSSTISDGTISQRIVTDIQARTSWLNAFKETARFFNDHPPFEIIFDPNLIQIGQTDYAKNTANIGMRIALYPSQAGFDALNALLEGLEKTGRREVWGFSGWPLMDVSPKTAGTVVFDGKRSFSYKVDVSLVNENNKTLGNSSITLTTESIIFSAGDRKVTHPGSVYNVVSFQNVKAEDLTPTLTIVIKAVNGISSRNLNASGYMKIETGDLEKLETAEQQAQQRQETSERRAQQQREAERQQAQAQKEREAATRKQEREYLRDVWFWGYNYAFNIPIGATLGLFSFYLSFNYGSSEFIDASNERKTEHQLEWIIGYSIPINRYFRIPVGIGSHHKFNNNESWNSFSVEAGLTFVIIEFLYISSTYRLILPDITHGFTIGIGFFHY
ncbi:MAG: hypothetical protein LBQ82_07495 [Treponema sp.]|nr:hypothetical protein [Treponema sp.]